MILLNVKIKPELQKIVNFQRFFTQTYCRLRNPSYICYVFFMVLDLRLIKIGCRETINFFISTTEITNRFI